MNKTQILEKLRSIGQLQSVKQEKLNDHLLSQIEGINIPLFRLQQEMFMARSHPPERLLDPFCDYAIKGNEAHFRIGKELIFSGKVGCLLIAGGQGTRLQFDGPKGMFPVSLIKKKSLFQLVAEKVAAASKQADRQLPLAVMTSPQNHEQTSRFFRDHEYFGLSLEQISFFIQKELPLLDHEGNLFLDRHDHIASGPDGNGTSLKYFVESGLWDQWYHQGVRYLNFILIDNPLADPFDPELVGFQYSENADVVIKCVKREDPEEKVGIIIEHEKKVKVVEYTELPEEERKTKRDNGTLKHVCANLSLFSFSMDFVKLGSHTQLPFHLAHKAVKYLDRDGKICQPDEPNAWKFETFIFDVLPLATKVKALLYPRSECFAPLKNVHGNASPEKVREALQTRDRQIFRQITGKEPSNRPFELSPTFYYPKKALLEAWKGRSLPEANYVE